MLRWIIRSLVALGIFTFVSVTRAGEITICSDVQPMIDFPDCHCGDVLPAKLPFAMFDYSGQPRLQTITGISVSMTIQDGDTGVGELDFNKLTLGLDSVDTGLKLNGFGKGKEPSLTLSWHAGDPGWPSQQKLAQILTDLNQDHQLVASILDATPGDNVVNLYSAFDTQVCLTGIPPGPAPVPEPTTLAVWGMLLATAVGWKRRPAA